VRSDNGIASDHVSVLATRTSTESELLSDTETSNRIKLAGAAESLLDKRIALEKQRTETARWKAQATRSYIPGPSEWSGDGPPRTAPAFERFWKDCELCGHTHKNGACPEEYRDGLLSKP